MNGCTDNSACNYNPSAVYDNGTCQFDEDCNEIFHLCTDFYSHLDCIAEEGCFWMGDHCMEGSICFDPLAENFNPLASTNGFNDNSQCIYSPYIHFGCTYPHAINFNSNAIVDDNSCQFDYNDVNTDGVIDILDIVIILNKIIELE